MFQSDEAIYISLATQPVLRSTLFTKIQIPVAVSPSIIPLNFHLLVYVSPAQSNFRVLLLAT